MLVQWRDTGIWNSNYVTTGLEECMAVFEAGLAHDICQHLTMTPNIDLRITQMVGGRMSFPVTGGVVELATF